MNIAAFTPVVATVTLAVTGTTGSVALGTQPSQGGCEVRVVNAGTATIFINFGTSAVTAATASSMPVLAGGAEVFSLNPSVTHVAAITASGTATLYATLGCGL